MIEEFGTRHAVLFPVAQGRTPEEVATTIVQKFGEVEVLTCSKPNNKFVQLRHNKLPAVLPGEPIPIVGWEFLLETFKN